MRIIDALCVCTKYIADNYDEQKTARTIYMWKCGIFEAPMVVNQIIFIIIISVIIYHIYIFPIKQKGFLSVFCPI